MITRRVLISISPAALFGLRATAFAADPWTAKKPEDWTEKDDRQILTRSPWAKHVSVEFGDPGDGGFDPGGAGPGGGPGPGGPGGGPPGGGGPPAGGPPGGGFPGGGGPGGPPEFNILVRWDSAFPVRLASKNSPDAATDYYLIFMSGLPMIGNPEQVPDDQDSGRLTGQLKSATSLQRKGKDPIYPDRVATVESSGQKGILFSFPRSPGTIAVSDKEVTFVTAMGPLRIKAKFNLKEMMYQGHLEL